MQPGVPAPHVGTFRRPGQRAAWFQRSRPGALSPGAAPCHRHARPADGSRGKRPGGPVSYAAPSRRYSRHASGSPRLWRRGRASPSSHLRSYHRPPGYPPPYVASLHPADPVLPCSVMPPGTPAMCDNYKNIVILMVIHIPFAHPLCRGYFRIGLQEQLKPVSGVRGGGTGVPKKSRPAGWHVRADHPVGSYPGRSAAYITSPRALLTSAAERNSRSRILLRISSTSPGALFFCAWLVISLMPAG